MRHPEHLDEGTIHAWLDGALAPDESSRVEAHVTGCAECAARVAEARGLVAGAGRVIAKLDDGVGVFAGTPPAARPVRRRRFPLAAVSAIAATFLVAVVGTRVASNRVLGTRQSPLGASAVAKSRVPSAESHAPNASSIASAPSSGSTAGTAAARSAPRRSMKAAGSEARRTVASASAPAQQIADRLPVQDTAAAPINRAMSAVAATEVAGQRVAAAPKRAAPVSEVGGGVSDAPARIPESAPAAAAPIAMRRARRTLTRDVSGAPVASPTGCYVTRSGELRLAIEPAAVAHLALGDSGAARLGSWRLEGRDTVVVTVGERTMRLALDRSGAGVAELADGGAPPQTVRRVAECRQW